MIERVLLATSVSPLLNGTSQQHAPQSYSIGIHNRNILEGKKRTQLHPDSIPCQQNFVTTRVKCYTNKSEKRYKIKKLPLCIIVFSQDTKDCLKTDSFTGI
jgi:hypothetical protein